MSDQATGHRGRRATLLLAVLVAAIAGALVVLLLLFPGPPNDREVDRLVDLLELGEGMTVAEIGAGAGQLTVEVARRVGPSGHVYSTELSRSRLSQIRTAADDARLANVTVIEAGEQSSNLTAGCCDAIFMRRVYHHLSDPPALVADLNRALKPGGRLVIIEFEASSLLGTVSGEGIDRAPLISEVTAAGFELIEADTWPGWGHYVAAFEKSGR